MFSCDYNGWADVPEEEREAIEAFELGSQVPAEPLPPLVILTPALPPPILPQRRAA